MKLQYFNILREIALIERRFRETARLWAAFHFVPPLLPSFPAVGNPRIIWSDHSCGAFRYESCIDQRLQMDNFVPMARFVLGLSLICAACGAVEQPKSAKSVAAYEVPLPTASDRQSFLTLLTSEAEEAGFHVDAATADELKATSEVSPQTFNATVWRGKDDDEPIASAKDFQDRLGRVWISFSFGQDPARSVRFRKSLMPAIMDRWPETVSLPIMPNGAIPLTQDLVRTPSGYIVSPSAAAKYDGNTK